MIRGDRDEDMGEVSRGSEVLPNETINVFSIASGHLYERFLRLVVVLLTSHVCTVYLSTRIMMLSVLKHTHNPVKFWFLKNYLSPTFKDFIPRMARQYDFEYELVQYKWPRWLHQQTEKQRMIWGYKILFLDVLFPLSVKKIIFVDADQVHVHSIKIKAHTCTLPETCCVTCDVRQARKNISRYLMCQNNNLLCGPKSNVNTCSV